MSAIQGSGSEGCLKFRGPIRGVSAIQGSGSEGCLRFRGPDQRGVCDSGVPSEVHGTIY